MANAAPINTSKQLAQAQDIIDTVQGKMHKVVDEFALGEISREQFQKIYEHYQSQIIMAAQMAAEADSLLGMDLTPGKTLAIPANLLPKPKPRTSIFNTAGLRLKT